MKLTNQFLIAPPSMTDPRFAGTLVYVARHDAHGALGFVVNQPASDIDLVDMLQDLDIEVNVSKLAGSSSGLYRLLHGGPVRPEVGFVLHTGVPSHWASSVAVTDNICLTTSKDVLKAIASGAGVANYQICLGHAAWQAGQLETEMSHGGWLSVAADTQLLFSLPHHERYQAALDKAGINLAWLSDDIGQA